MPRPIRSQLLLLVLPALMCLASCAGRSRAPASSKAPDSQQTAAAPPAPPAAPYQPRPEPSEEVKQDREEGCRKIGKADCEALTQALDWRMLQRRRVIDECLLLTVAVDPSDDENWRLVVLSPDHRVVEVVASPSPNWLRLEGRWDIDGDGHKEALLSSYSGGAHCCTSCYFVRLGKNAAALGGFDATHGDAGKPKDIDRDGRTEFIAQDYTLAYFETSFGGSPVLPFIYGYRDGRFVDLTPDFARKEIERRIAQVRRDLLAARKERGEDMYVGAAAGEWYALAAILGAEQRAFDELNTVLKGKAWGTFMKSLPDLKERVASRSRLLWTGRRPPEPEE